MLGLASGLTRKAGDLSALLSDSARPPGKDFHSLWIFTHLFFCGWLWVFVTVCELSLVEVCGPLIDFSCCGAWTLWCMGIRSCGIPAYLLYGLWDLPGPGIKPMSPALASWIPTTGPPRRSHVLMLLQVDLTLHFRIPLSFRCELRQESQLQK